MDGLAVGVRVLVHRDESEEGLGDLVEAHVRPGDRVHAVVGGDVGVCGDLPLEVVVLHRVRRLVFAEGHPELLVVGAVPVVVAPAVDGGREVLLVVREAVAVGVAVGPELALQVGTGLVDGVVEAGCVVPGVAEAVEAGVGRAGVEVEERQAVAVVVAAGLLVLADVGDAVAVGVAVPRVGRVLLVGPVRRPGLVPRRGVVVPGHLVLLDVDAVVDLGLARVVHRPVLELVEPDEAVALLVVRVGAEGPGAEHRQGVERGPDVVDQVDRARGLVAGVERPAVGDVVLVGVVAAGVERLDRLHPVVVPPHRGIDGVHEHRVVAAVVLADHPLLDVELLAGGEGDVEVAGGGRVRAGAGKEAEGRLAVPEHVVEVVVEECVAVAVAARRVHHVAVGVLGRVARGVGIEREEDLPAVGQAVDVGVPVHRVGAEEVLLVVGEAVAVEVGDTVPLAGVDPEGAEDRGKVGIALPLVVPEPDDRVHRVELGEQPALGEEAVQGAVARGERGVAVADERLEVVGEVVVAGQEELAGEEVDVGAGDLAGLERRPHRRGIDALLAVVARLGAGHRVVVRGLPRVVEELGAAERVDVAVARVDLEAAQHEDDGGGRLLVGGGLVVGDGGDRRVGEVVGTVAARGGVEVGAAVVALVADQLGLELLVAVADEEAAVVLGLEALELPAQEREARPHEVSAAAGGEVRVEGEGRVERAPAVGVVLVEDGGPEVVLPAVLLDVAVGVRHGRVGGRAVAAERDVLDHLLLRPRGSAGDDARIAVGAPVRMVLVGGGGLGQAAELEDVGEEGLRRGRLAGKGLVGGDAGDREDRPGGVAGARAVVDVVAGERVLEHADEVDHPVRVVVVGILRPDVLDLLVLAGGDPVVVRRVVAVVPGAVAVPERAGGAVAAGGVGDREVAPVVERALVLGLVGVEVVGLPLVGEAVLVEVAEVVVREVGIRGEVADRPDARLGRVDADRVGVGIGDVAVGRGGGESVGVAVGELPSEGIGHRIAVGVRRDDRLDHRAFPGVEVVARRLVPGLLGVVLLGRPGIDDEVRGAVPVAGLDLLDRALVGEDQAAGLRERRLEVAHRGVVHAVVGADGDALPVVGDAVRDGRVRVGRVGPEEGQGPVLVLRGDVPRGGREDVGGPEQGADGGGVVRVEAGQVQGGGDVGDRDRHGHAVGIEGRLREGERDVRGAVLGLEGELPPGARADVQLGVVVDERVVGGGNGEDAVRDRVAEFQVQEGVTGAAFGVAEDRRARVAGREGDGRRRRDGDIDLLGYIIERHGDCRRPGRLGNDGERVEGLRREGHGPARGLLSR